MRLQQALDPVDQGLRGPTRGVDHLGAGGDHRCTRVQLESGRDGRDVGRLEQVVAPHEDDVLGTGEREDAVEVLVDSEVGRVAVVLDAGVVEGIEPAADGRVRVAVVEHDQPEVRGGLVEHTAYSGVQQPRVAVEGQQDVDHVTATDSLAPRSSGIVESRGAAVRSRSMARIATAPATANPSARTASSRDDGACQSISRTNDLAWK